MAAIFHRRRAERFAQLLDQADGRSHRHSRTPLDEELAGYVALGRMVSGRDLTAQHGPDPDFRSSLRAMLVATAEREGIGVTAGKDQRRKVLGPVYLSASAQSGTSGAPRSGKRPVLGSRRTRGAIIVGIAAGTLALSGMSMASGDAMPGDPLYGVKRSTESAQLALTGSDIDRGQAYLGFARNRILEASTVRDNPSRVEGTLGDMDNQTVQGIRLLTGVAVNQHDSTALNVIDDFVTAQRPLVTELTTNLSGPAKARAQQSVNLLDQVGRRVAGLRAALLCGSVVTASDALGPTPPACPGASRAGQTPPADPGH